ncbi:hypothetical protein GCM10011363_45470 [Marivita lacus]|uniref:Polysaccharide biosynthesis protein C-terminal domain-containing protein n=1 Tax=Marivita lacus TaxID=1323742 RepID=A0ABQ1LL62_9RHOB|nr:polysaccharide biosynthesis C-terminal domain-containing protein [Marivita lacus]GGC23822.1 hypothetical protein GCM10011363_45470 [Marivita lacus]
MRQSWITLAKTLYAGALRFAATLTMLAFAILGTRLLGPETFGSYISVMAVATIATTALGLGLPALLGREVAAVRGGAPDVLLGPVGQWLLIINLLVALCALGALALGQGMLALALFFVVVANGAQTLGIVTTGFERVMFAQTVGGLIRPVATLCFLFVMVWLIGPTASAPLWAQLLGATTALLILLVGWRGPGHMAAITRMKIAGLWSPNHPHALRQGLVYAGSQTLINASTQIDVILLTLLAQPRDVAAYYAVSRAAIAVSFFFNAAGLLAAPAMTRLWAEGKRKEMTTLARQTARLGAVLTVCGAVGAWMLAEFYLSLYVPEFLPEIWGIRVLVAAYLIVAFMGPTEQLLRAIGREADVMRIFAATCFLNAVLSVMLIPIMGVLGAVIGTAVQLLASWVALYVMVRRRLGLRVDILAFDNPLFQRDGTSKRV